MGARVAATPRGASYIHSVLSLCRCRRPEKRLCPTVSSRALAGINQNNSRCLIDFLLQQSRAGFLAIPCDANPAKAPKGRSPAGISTDFAHAKRVKSLFKRAGDRYRSATRENWPQAGRAALTPGRRAHRASYWPGGRENILCPRAGPPTKTKKTPPKHPTGASISVPR